MRSSYFYAYHIIAWLLVFAVITASIVAMRGLSEYELVYAAALIGTAAIYGLVIRALYKRFLAPRGLGFQIIYFVVQSLIGASLSGFALVLTVLAFSALSLITPIPSEVLVQAMSTLFWANSINMFIALVFWCAAYLLIIKARQVYEVKEALSSSQLEALSQQLNPHFLFNTLNNIRATILEDPEKARNALSQLSDMLRYTLQQQQQSKVLLAQELAITHEYIALCKIQFEARLQFACEVAEEAKHALIPRLLLQLCVENAIKHGIAKIREGGLIHLNINVEDIDIKERARLSIVVTNPVAQEGASYLKKDLISEDASPGVGIKNIQQRLALMYVNHRKTKAKLSFTKDKQRATVRIVLPLEYDANNMDNQCE